MEKVNNDGIVELQRYLRGVVANSKHHAPGVQGTIMAMVGPTLVYKDPDAPIEVLVREGEMKNLMATAFGGQRYAFSYGHDERSIVIKRGNVQGDIVASLNDKMTAAEITDAVKRLRKN